MITIKTTAQLQADIKADLESAYGSTIPLFIKCIMMALTIVQAGKLRLFYLAIAFLQKNIFADTADQEADGGTLERFGRTKINRNPFPARAGEYIVTVTGTVGATIPGQTTFKSNDDSLNPGMLYVIDNDYILTGSGDVATLRALDAGLDSKLDVNDFLTATAPIPSVNAIVQVQSESVQPLAAEDIEDYRALVIESYRLEAQGGAVGDFRLWSHDVQGVKRVYPYPTSGQSGEINLYIESAVIDSIDGKGTPSEAMISEVEDVVELDPDTTKDIDERGRRPMGIFEIHYLPIIPLDVDIQISSFEDVTPDIETLIFNAMKLMVDQIRPFIAGADVLANKNDILDINKIIVTILNARPGSVFGAIQLTVNGVVETSHTFQFGDIPNMDAITYV